MAELRCTGCRASLPSRDENVKFITCEWCRATNKNPNFRQTPSVTIKEDPIIPQHPTVNQNNRESIMQTTDPIPVKTPTGRPVNKWIAFLLCYFTGVLGVHKFYEGKIGTGLLYLFTFGLFGLGVIVDLIIIVFKPNPYYVNK
ncbi:MAG: TM2 domain-containing protein [Defluviitaleaceae bacterium]|nr:TM2 domain-containing protein [Defluviitaleaceae bacterium]